MKTNHNGFSLVEVLISLLILSLILLGLDAMQVSALRENRHAYFFTVAVNQLHSIRERLRAVGVRDGVEQQIAKWNEENSKVLPQGIGTVSGHFPAYTVNLFWGEISKKNCNEIEIGLSGCLQEKIVL